MMVNSFGFYTMQELRFIIRQEVQAELNRREQARTVVSGKLRQLLNSVNAAPQQDDAGTPPPGRLS